MAGPFTAFNFRVSIALGDQSTDPLCDAAFSECGGLEVVTEVKTIREGGNNNRPVHLTGPVSYGTLSLKRGMTSSFDLWDWVDRVSRTASAICAPPARWSCSPPTAPDRRPPSC